MKLNTTIMNNQKMKKATKFTFYLSLWVIGLCTIGMFMTFASDFIQSSGFFGDVKRSVPNNETTIDEWYDWGARHYWYFWMCVFLFFISVVRIVMWINHYWEKEEK